MHFWKSAKQALWVKIQLYKLAKKKTGIGEYKYAHIFYILIGIFPFTEELNSIDTTSETAYILLWFLRTPCRQEEECFVYNFSGLSNLVASGPTTMMVIQERDFWEKKMHCAWSVVFATSRVQWAGDREGEETAGRLLCCPFTTKEDDKVIDQCCVLRTAPAVQQWSCRLWLEDFLQKRSIGLD